MERTPASASSRTTPTAPPDAEFIDAFLHAYASDRRWIKDGVKQRHADGDYSKPVAVWISVRARAKEVTEQDPAPGEDYCITEIVRCRSQRKIRVADALNEYRLTS